MLWRWRHCPSQLGQAQDQRGSVGLRQVQADRGLQTMAQWGQLPMKIWLLQLLQAQRIASRGLMGVNLGGRLFEYF